jgi:hypothetical protein
MTPGISTAVTACPTCRGTGYEPTTTTTTDGYNEKAIADAVKLLRADPDKVLATLMFEAERDVYRRAAGVPVEIEAAQRAAQAAADTVPAPKKKRGER